MYGGDTMWTMMSFVAANDSGMTRMKIGEFKINGSRIILDNWCWNRTIHNSPDGQLSDSSTTLPMVVSTNDTITFYRQLDWMHLPEKYQQTDNYYAEDTLDFVVELREASSRNLLDVIDSVGILSQIPTGSPTIYGNHGLAAVVKYVVPSTYDGDSVYLRMKVRTRGPGNYYLMRYDGAEPWPSTILQDSSMILYLEQYGDLLARPTVRQLTDAVNHARDGVILSAIPNPTTGDVNISYSAKQNQGAMSIAVFDAAGNRIFMPVMNPTGSASSGSASYHFESSGTYFVALAQEGVIMRAVRVEVIR